MGSLLLWNFLSGCHRFQWLRSSPRPRSALCRQTNCWWTFFVNRWSNQKIHSSDFCVHPHFLRCLFDTRGRACPHSGASIKNGFWAEFEHRSVWKIVLKLYKLLQILKNFHVHMYRIADFAVRLPMWTNLVWKGRFPADDCARHTVCMAHNSLVVPNKGGRVRKFRFFALKIVLKVFFQKKIFFSAVLYANRHYLRLYREHCPEKLAIDSVCTIIGDVYIDPTARIDPSAKIGPNVSIGANAHIRAGSKANFHNFFTVCICFF